jgi:type IV pilus assembly protein PilV
LNTRDNNRAADGFSLVEVMVAVVVICVGLLGIAKMQSLSLSNMTTSRLRSLAAFEAAGLAAAMHTNRDYWAATPANFTINVSTTANPVIASSDPALQAGANADLTNLNACVGTAAGAPACPNSVDLAAYDLARWVASLEGLLPNPTAAISCPNVAGALAPTSCTIQVSWSETAVSINQQQVTQQALGNNANQGFDTPTYLLYVEP